MIILNASQSAKSVAMIAHLDTFNVLTNISIVLRDKVTRGGQMKC